MNIRHELITLGLAFSLLGSTSAFARPTLHFENGGLSYEKKTVASHVPTTKAFGATDYARPPSANADKDGWPADISWIDALMLISSPAMRADEMIK